MHSVLKIQLKEMQFSPGAGPLREPHERVNPGGDVADIDAVESAF